MFFTADFININRISVAKASPAVIARVAPETAYFKEKIPRIQVKAYARSSLRADSAPCDTAQGSKLECPSKKLFANAPNATKNTEGESSIIANSAFGSFKEIAKKFRDISIVKLHTTPKRNMTENEKLSPASMSWFFPAARFFEMN